MNVKQIDRTIGSCLVAACLFGLSSSACSNVAAYQRGNLAHFTMKPNDASSVALLRIGDVTFLLTGDAEADEERWLLAHQRALLRADVLKVAHHGSRTSSIPEFLDAVRPRLALVSVGAGNVYRHPSPEVMQSLAGRGTVTMRTDLHGTVVVRTDGRRIEVEAAGERWMLKP